MDINPEDTAEVAAGVVIGAPSLWLLFKKMLVRNAVETTSQGAAEAQTEVIELLRGEIRRAYEALDKSESRVERMRADIDTLQEQLRVIKLRENREEIYEQIRNQDSP